MVLPSITIASFGLLDDGMPFRVFMTRHILVSSASVMESCRNSFQLSSFAFSISSWVALQASSHSFLLVRTWWRSAFLFLMAARTGGVTQGFVRLPGLVLPRCFSAALVMILLNLVTPSLMSSVGVISCTAASISSWKDCQSTSFVFHLAYPRNTLLCFTKQLSSIRIGLWSELPIPSIVCQLTLLFHILPHREMSGVLLFPVERLMRLGEPSFRRLRSFSINQSSISSPLLSGGWIESQRIEWALKSPRMNELLHVGIISVSRRRFWFPKAVDVEGGHYTFVILTHLFRASLTEKIEFSVASLISSFSLANII